MKTRFFHAALTPLLFLGGCATAQTTPNAPNLSNVPNAAPVKDDRVADITVQKIDAPAGVLRERGFAIDAPTQVEPLAPSFEVPNDVVHVRAGDDLKAAINGARDGQTVVIESGLYRVGEINVGKRKLTIQNAPGAKVWLSGCEVVTGWNEENGVWVASWDTWFGRAKNIDDPYLDKANFPLAAEREMVFADGMPLFQVASRKEVGPGKFFADKEKNQLVIGVDPNGRAVEATKWEKGLGLYEAGCVVRGLGFKGYADWGLHVAERDVTVDSNTFAWNAQAGFKISRNEGGVVIRNNLAIANGRKGGDVVRSKGISIDGNRFAFNNVEGFRLQWDAAGLKVLEATDVVVENNVADNNNSSGLWLDVDVDNARMNNNVAFNNRAVGLFFEVSKGAIIEDNVAYNNGTGVQVANASGAVVRNNTLWDNAQGWVVKWTKRKTLNPNDGDAIYQTKDNVFENNLVALTGARKDALLVDMSHVQGEPATEFVEAKNNTYVVAPHVQGAPILWSVKGGWDKRWDDVTAIEDQTGGEVGSRLVRDAKVKIAEKNGVAQLEVEGLK